MTTVTHLNPPSLHSVPAFLQGTSNGDGNVLDGLEEQSKQAFSNMLAVLDFASSVIPLLSRPRTTTPASRRGKAS